jgi:hypothetical protein
MANQIYAGMSYLLLGMPYYCAGFEKIPLQSIHWTELRQQQLFENLDLSEIAAVDCWVLTMV